MGLRDGGSVRAFRLLVQFPSEIGVMAPKDLKNLGKEPTALAVYRNSPVQGNYFRDQSTQYMPKHKNYP